MNKDCVSLEVAKELQAAGYNKFSHYAYRDSVLHAGVGTYEQEHDTDIFPAPTATQLAEELPKKCPTHEGMLVICPAFSTASWFVGYGDHTNLHGCHVEDGPLPDAPGKMMVYLLTNHLL